MTTKAQMLSKLKGKLNNAQILDLYFFTVQNFLENPKYYIDKISACLPETTLFIVRSSSIYEDQTASSNAGKFDSLLNVSKEKLGSAIKQVIASYGGTKNPLDEVLVQAMLNDVSMSGVLFTLNPRNAAPYYVINYARGEDTAAVTSGVEDGQVCYIAHDSKIKTEFTPLINLATELVSILDNPALDIEFAFNRSGELFLFQVRPLLCAHAFRCEQINFKQVLADMQARFNSACKFHPYLHGQKTILGIMPDWNPAEIIGIQPKPLALSLYKELITDSTWAYQRDNYGYRNMRGFPLLLDLMGLPYVDVRVSFNSFIAKDLPDALAEKLANFYLEQLEHHPHLHDKIEFDIIYSCYTFDFSSKVQKLKDHGFSEDEIDVLKHSLKSLTNSIINNREGLWIKDVNKIKTLEERQNNIFFNKSFNEVEKIYWLLEDCKRYGTLPFAGLARAGFIAMQLLNSMVEEGILDSADRMAFLNSLNTVSSQMTHDFHHLDKEHFLHKYGHLRPGTYDILSPRYDEAPDLYFDWEQRNFTAYHERKEFRLSLLQLEKIEELLKEHGLQHDVVGLFTFIKAAIEGREHAKFIFTKSLSDIISLIKNYGRNMAIEVEELAYLDIKDLIKAYSSSWPMEEEILHSIARGREKYKITRQISLPPLIKHADEIEYFELPSVYPSFVTNKNTVARVVSDLNDLDSMENSIVFIPSADPGYDWLFTRKIAGFVTAYGGTNSHMSIRASELNIPAVIGVGETLFKKWSSASKIHLDCLSQRVEIVS